MSELVTAEVRYYDDGSDIANYGQRTVRVAPFAGTDLVSVATERPGGEFVLDRAALTALGEGLRAAVGIHKTMQMTVVFGDLTHFAPDGTNETWSEAQIQVERDGELVRIENLSESNGAWGGSGISFELTPDDALRLAILCGA